MLRLRAGDGPQARQKLSGVEGLGQIVVGAQVQPGHLVLHLALGGQHEDGG